VSGCLHDLHPCGRVSISSNSSNSMIEVILVIYFNSNPALTPLQERSLQFAKNAEKYAISTLNFEKISGGIAPRRPYWGGAVAPLPILHPRGEHLDCQVLRAPQYLNPALADQIKVLGVTLDKHLTFVDHVTAVCKSAYYHIRAMRHIRPAITEDMAKSIACALVGSRLDYANSVLLACHQKTSPVFNVRRTLPLGSSSGAPGDQQTLLAYLNSYRHWLPV